MKRFIDAGRDAVRSNNLYSALGLALVLPDVCGQLGQAFRSAATEEDGLSSISRRSVDCTQAPLTFLSQTLLCANAQHSSPLDAIVHLALELGLRRVFKRMPMEATHVAVRFISRRAQ
jgi:hypothetical protein